MNDAIRGVWCRENYESALAVSVLLQRQIDRYGADGAIAEDALGGSSQPTAGVPAVRPPSLSSSIDVPAPSRSPWDPMALVDA